VAPQSIDSGRRVEGARGRTQLESQTILESGMRRAKIYTDLLTLFDIDVFDLGRRAISREQQA
jgi:hypothetical protein